MKQGNLPNSVTPKGFLKRITLLIAILSLFFTSGFAQTYPFPQNYKYPYGQIYTATGTTVKDKIQGLYNTWKSTYYVEGSIGGTACARIKFQQPGQDGSATVSEGIAYGMLIFVYMDNATNSTQDEFNKLWAYYQKNVNGNGVMNWKVNAFTGQVAAGTGNANGATDAEVDVAQALLMAHKQWGSAGAVNYLTAARTLINTIYMTEVDGNKLLKPGDAFNDWANPSYYIMNATELFGRTEVSEGWQATNRWSAVTTACYNLMKTSRNATSGLVPDWTTTPGGGLISGIITDKFESYFLYDAVRVPWRMAQAYAWYGHTDAKDIASKITTWAQTNYNDPAGIWDGYLLNGSVFNNPTGNANFTNLGKNHNPCFSGGLSIGSMVDATFATYMGKCWTVGSATDQYPAYFTQTTQLLYMLCLTGNMPNLWDMKPVPTAAETNANGNIVYVDFSKAIGAATTSTAGWTVSTYANDTDVTATNVTITSVAVDGTNPKRVVVTLTTDITEPIIKINYSGTLLGGTDASKVDAFTNFVVTNKITNMEPYPINRMTNVLGTQVLIQWSKPIAPASINAAHFTVKVGGTATTISSAALDGTDPSILILTIPGGVITSSTQAVTVSFAGGSITSTTSTKTAQPFTNSVVQNFYMSVTCYNIENFDAVALTWAGSGTGSTWSSLTADPASAQAGNVGKLVVTTSQTYHNVKGEMSAALATAFNTALASGSKTLKFRMYVTGQHATDKTVRVRIFAQPTATPNNWGDHMYNDFTVTTTGAWVNYEFDLTGQYNSALVYNWIGIEPSPEDASAETVYIDDIRVCPPPPTVNFVNGRLNYDGSEIEIKYNTAMKVPTSASAISISADGFAVPVTSIVSKQGDASVLVLSLGTPISSAAAVVTATYNGVGGSVYAFDGRIAENYYDAVIANLYNISITTGWRDDFTTTTDFITANIGGGTNFTGVESATAPGTYTLTGTGTVEWAPASVTVYGTGATDLKQVMDLTGREIVQIRYRVPAATSTTLLLRIDVKDKVNTAVSDQFTIIPLTFTAGSATYIDRTFNLNFYSQYGSPSGPVDRSNIQQVSFHFLEKEGTAANSYVPTNFKGQIQFDYISIGSALTLTGVPANVNEGSPVAGTSSATGKIFLVPAGTPPMLSAMQDSVFAGRGKLIDVTAAVAGSIPTTGLAAGYYEAYAYDPTAGALSAKVGVNINDITAPIITQSTSGNVAPTGTITATVNENATLYLIPASITNYAIANIIDNMVYSLQVAKDVSTAILLSDVPGIAVGQTYKFIAADYAYPNPNVSSVTTPNITIVNAALTMSVTPTGAVEQGDPLSVSVNRAATAYLVPNTVLVSTVTDLTSNDVSNIAISGLVGTLQTTGVPVGEYYVYVSDGTSIVGPSAKITIQVSYTPVTAIALTSSSLALNVGETKTTTVQFTPASPSNKGITITADASYVTATYNIATGVVSVTGVKAGTIQVTLESVDGPSTTLNLTITQLPTSVSVTPATTTNLTVTGTVQLTATVLPADANVKTVTWTSSNPAVATVSATGLVTGVAIGGPVTITATCTAAPAITGTASVTVVKTDVTAVTVAPTTVSITIGGTATVTPTIVPANATNTNVTWTSSAPAVASVTNGVISGLTVGTATITVASVDNPAITATVAVTVTAASVTSVTVTPTTATILVNATTTLTPTVLPGTATQTVTYTSSNPAVATVSATGVVTGISVGTATITVASTADGTKTATCAITVNPILVSSITVTPTTLSLYINDVSSPLTANVLPANATNPAYTWSSSNPAVATVNASGVVTAVSAGSATITATASDASGKTATCAVTVNSRLVTGITLTPSTVTLNIGGTQSITATVAPANATNGNVTWTSSNPAVATVSATGVVTAVSIGSATITCAAADASGITATCAVTVSAKPVTSITIAPATNTLYIGDNVTLSASVLPADATNPAVTWTSSNPAVATVSAAGLVNAVSAGTATITATAADGSLVTGTASVTVNPRLVTGITLTPSTVTLNIGGTQSITASVAPINATNNNVTWTSSNPAVATVSATGVVTAVSVGSATITCAAADASGITATCAVTVNAILPTSVSTSTAIGFVTGDPAQTLVASILPVNATVQTVTWTSSNPAVATVSATGVVTPVGVGTCTITVSCNAAPAVTAVCNVTVVASVVNVTGVTMSVPTLTINIGSTGTLTATIAPANASNPAVTWTSSNPAVATVANGVVSGISLGSSTITVTSVDGSFTATCAVTVSAISVTGVTVAPTTLSLSATSAPSTLVATVAPVNASNQNVTWSSSAPAVVTVSTTGVVSVVGIGTATITVTTVDGSFTATCAVTVSAIPVTGITLSQTTLAMTMTSTPVQLTTTIAPATASDQTVTWTSSNPAAATVNASGVVSPTGIGSATITATANDGSGITSTCAVTVSAISVTGVTVAPTTLSLLVGGSTGTLTPTIAPATASNQSVTWSSSAPAVATVANGIVTPVSAGTATITVTTVDGSFTATCAVTVGTTTIPVTGVTVSAPTVSIVMGQTSQATAIIAPATATNSNVTWTSSNPAVATVSATGLITSVSVGSATITVTTTDGSFTATVAATVTPILTTSISIENTATVVVGATTPLTATVVPTGASTNVTWTSSNPAVATVSTSGVVTGVSAGVTSITATSTDGTSLTSNPCNVTVSNLVIPVTSVTFTQTTGLTVSESGTFNLGALLQINPTNASVSTVTWTSGDPTLATVSSTGVVSGRTVSINTPVNITVTVTATNGVVTTQFVTITVTNDPILVNSIVIPATQSIEVGGGVIMTATSVAPANADNRTITWSIASGTGGTIDPVSGQILVTGTAGQTFTVIATANDAGAIVSNNCIVTIIAQVIPVTGISVSQTAVTVNKNGTSNITITFNPTATTQTGLSVDVGSSGVVSYSQISATEYQITGLRGGTQQVVFRSTYNPSVISSVMVTVNELVETITVTGAGGSNSVNINNTLQLQAQVSQTSATNRAVVWASSNPSIASVSAAGLVTGIAEGSVYITATAVDGSDVEGQFLVNVSKIPVTSIATNNIDELEITKTTTIQYTLYPSNASFPGVSFVSSDENIATVDANGVVTAIAEGDITIQVISVDDNNISGTLTVHVIPIKADVAYLETLIFNDIFGAYSVYYKVNPESGNPQDAEIRIGFADGEVSPLTYNEFLNAWSEAQDVYYDALVGAADQTAVDAAADALYNAIVAMGVEIEISIDEVEILSATVYPTICTSQITVESANIESVAIVSISGTIASIVDVNGADSVVISTEQLSQGTYFVKVKTDKGTIVKTIIK